MEESHNCCWGYLFLLAVTGLVGTNGAEITLTKFKDADVSKLEFYGDAEMYECDAAGFSAASYTDGFGEVETLFSPPESTAIVMEYHEQLSRDYTWEMVSVERDTVGCPYENPVIRLVSSKPNQTGAVWWHVSLFVHIGFSTSFKFRFSGMRQSCFRGRLETEDYNQEPLRFDFCEKSAANGFAFLLRGDNSPEIGEGGAGMGYAGIKNSYAVEVDVFHDGQNSDMDGPHFSAQTRGPTKANSANHYWSHGEFRIPIDVLDGEIHEMKIVYSPTLDNSAALPIRSTTVALPFITQKETTSGVTCVYLDDLELPQYCVLTNLVEMLDLPSTKANVGFTASTGEAWAAVDISEWKYCFGVGCIL